MRNHFVEKPELRAKNDHVMNQNRAQPALLADGDNGVMIRVDSRIHVMTMRQAERFANAILNAMEDTK